MFTYNIKVIVYIILHLFKFKWILINVESKLLDNTMNTIVESCSTMSACDKLTMDTMININAYSKYISKRDTDVKTRSDETKNERRFYKKRIMALTKQLIKNPTYTNDTSIINACTAYINACIMHFKFIDLADTIQKEHTFENENGVTLSNIDTKLDECFEENVNKIDNAFLLQDARMVKKVNIHEKNILEQLFVSPPSEDSTSKPNNHGPTSLPRVIEIDLKDRQFKTKGIKHLKNEKTVKNNASDPDAKQNNHIDKKV